PPSTEALRAAVHFGPNASGGSSGALRDGQLHLGAVQLQGAEDRADPVRGAVRAGAHHQGQPRHRVGGAALLGGGVPGGPGQGEQLAEEVQGVRGEPGAGQVPRGRGELADSGRPALPAARLLLQQRGAAQRVVADPGDLPSGGPLALVAHVHLDRNALPGGPGGGGGGGAVLRRQRQVPRGEQAERGGVHVVRGARLGPVEPAGEGEQVAAAARVDPAGAGGALDVAEQRADRPAGGVTQLVDLGGAARAAEEPVGQAVPVGGGAAGGEIGRAHV